MEAVPAVYTTVGLHVIICTIMVKLFYFLPFLLLFLVCLALGQDNFCSEFFELTEK